MEFNVTAYHYSVKSAKQLVCEQSLKGMLLYCERMQSNCIQNNPQSGNLKLRNAEFILQPHCEM